MALLTFARKVGTAVVFELHGVLDGATADGLSARVSAALDEGERLVIFDLGKLTFASSAGLSVFLTTYRHLQNVGHLRFAALQNGVRQLFNIVALTPRVELYDTVADALVGPRP